jgi:hypothetical protein
LTEQEWDNCQSQWSLGVTASEYIRRLVQQDMRQRHKQD